MDPFKRKRILVDLDSTVADLHTPWLKAYNAEYHDDLTVDRIASWGLHQYAKAGEAIYDTLAKEGLFRNLLPLPGAIAGVKALFDDGHQVIIVTACSYAVGTKEKVEWVHEHLPFLGKQDIIVCHNKHLIAADVLIDDNPNNANAYRNAHPKAFITTISYPYNLNYVAYDYVAFGYLTTSSAWEDIVDTIRDHLRRTP